MSSSDDSESENVHKCTVCGKIFPTPAGRNIHRSRVHFGSKKSRPPNENTTPDDSVHQEESEQKHFDEEEWDEATATMGDDGIDEPPILDDVDVDDAAVADETDESDNSEDEEILVVENLESQQTPINDDETPTHLPVSKVHMLMFKLASWRYKNQIPISSMDEMLCLLKEFSNEVSQLPRCFKTVVRKIEKLTPPVVTRSKTFEIVSVTEERIGQKKTGIRRKTCQSFVVKARSVVDLIFKSLKDPKLNNKKNIILGYDGSKGSYGDINTGQWMKDEQIRIRKLYARNDVYLLPLIFYADGTTVDKFGKRSMKPLILSLGIFNQKVRNTVRGKQCVTYFPVTDKTVSAESYLQLYHDVWKFVLEEIENEVRDKSFIMVNLDGFGPVKLVPTICFLPADHPEAELLACHLNNNSTAMPCRICLAETHELNQLKPFDCNPQDKKSKLRIAQKMNRVRSTTRIRSEGEMSVSAECAAYSLKPDVDSAFEDNELLRTSQGIYGATPPCIMHTFLSQGLVKRLIDAIVSIITDKNWKGLIIRYQKDRLREFNDRWTKIPNYAVGKNYLKKFKSNFSNLSLLTASDYLHILMQIRCVLGTIPDMFMPKNLFVGVVRCIDLLHVIVRQIKYCTDWDDAKIKTLSDLIVK